MATSRRDFEAIGRLDRRAVYDRLGGQRQSKAGRAALGEANNEMKDKATYSPTAELRSSSVFRPSSLLNRPPPPPNRGMPPHSLRVALPCTALPLPLPPPTLPLLLRRRPPPRRPSSAPPSVHAIALLLTSSDLALLLSSLLPHAPSLCFSHLLCAAVLCCSALYPSRPPRRYASGHRPPSA